MTEATFDLSFVDTGERIELESLKFKNPILSNSISLVRGKDAGALYRFGSFQWTTGVRAICVLLLRAAAGKAPFIYGVRGSLASSLDYSIDKRTEWITDLFGVDAAGKPLVGRFLKRTNPGGRRSGHIVVGLNSRILALDDILVALDGELVPADRRLHFLEEFERGVGYLTDRPLLHLCDPPAESALSV